LGSGLLINTDNQVSCRFTMLEPEGSPLLAVGAALHRPFGVGIAAVATLASATAATDASAGKGTTCEN